MNLPNLNKPVKRNRFGKKIALAGLIPSSEELDESSGDTEAGDEGGAQRQVRNARA